MKTRIIGNSKSIGICFSGLLQKVVDLNKTPFCKSPHKFHIKDIAMTNHWVGHLLMKPIDVDGFFNRNFIVR